MDASGVVIAASEVISFEKGCGIILMVYNMHMNLTFYVLAKDTMVILWKNVLVNHYYYFSNLKIGAIEWLSGSKIIVLLTTLKSKYNEILEQKLEKFPLSSKLMEKISIPAISLQTEIHSFSKLISYQGIVTKVENSKLGIYKLDNKIHLYCLFNSIHSFLPTLKEGYEVFISNVHFFIDFKGRKVLVCCGLSSVRPVESAVIIENNPLVTNFSHYPISIFDVIWLEMLLLNLNRMFCPTVICRDFTFNWENEILNNILECFSYPSVESCSKRQSLGDEFCSNPHSCGVFCDDILPTGSEILHISEMLDKASKRIVWTENSSNWKTCFIQNEIKYILIGMLYLSKDGCWYIMDKSYSIPVVFTRSCNQCKMFNNIFCSFENINLGYLIALQDFEIVYEKIKYDFNNDYYYRYLKTSCCCVFYLGTFCKQKDNLFYLVSVQENQPLHLTKNDSIEELIQELKCITFDKQNLLVDSEKKYCFSPYNEDLQNNNASHYVLMLNKIWTIINHTFVCYQVIALLLPTEKIHKEYFDKSKSLFGESYNFYETEDDYDFAELVNQIDSLYLEDKPRLVRLHFESTRQCALLLPGHIYVINFSGQQCGNDAILSAVPDKSNSKPVLIKIKPNMKIHHHVDCLGNHYPDEYEIDVYKTIKQITSERKVCENSLVKAILKDKLYEQCTNSSTSLSEADKNKTFCLILKDCTSEDTIKVYLPFLPKNIYGFLPGIELQMWGFACLCSKRGYLYLKPLSSFGIQINSDAFKTKNMILELDHINSDLRISSLQRMPVDAFFKCICFIIRIVSVKLYLSCNSCEKDFMQKCLCLCTYSARLEISFIIDDGTAQILAYSADEDAAKQILMLKENDWEGLTSYLIERKTSFNFHYKMTESDFDSLSLMDKIFAVYCSSKFISRQLCLKCKKKSDGFHSEQASVWCYDVLKIQNTDLITELIIKVKKSLFIK